MELIHQAGHFQRGDPGPCCAGFGPPAVAVGCQGYGCGLCAAGLERLMISAWSVSFSVESGLHAETEYQRGIDQKIISVGLQSHLSFSVEFFS